MPRSLQYIVLFAAVALLQLFMFNNMNLSVYVHPMIYLAFVVLLPVELAPVWVLLSALAMGVVMDVGAGTPGLNCSAVLFAAFARPLLLRLGIGREDLREGGGMPTRALMGTWGFLKYALALVLAHALVYFPLEAATWSYFYLTAIRIVASTLVTTALVYLCQLFYVSR